MVKIEIVEKCKSWLGLNSLHQTTLASLSNSFYSVFKKNPSHSENASKPTGLFGFEELKEPKYLDLLLKDSVRKTEIIMHEIKKKNHKFNPAMVCDKILDLYRVKRLAEFVIFTHPDKEFVDVAKQVYFKANKCIDKINESRRFYNFLIKAKEDQDPVLEREPIDACLIDTFLQSFESGGLFLAGKRRSISLPRREPKVRRGKWWQISVVPPPNKWFVMLNERLELALRFGFYTYAEFALADTIAGTPDFVLRFLEDMKKRLKPLVDKDLREIMQEKDFKSTTSVLQSDNISHLISKSKKKILGIDSCVEDYFSLDGCMDGLKLILRSLYGIILEDVADKDITSGELWHDDVKKYCVREGNEILGHIYFDLFARPDKSSNKTYLIQSGKMYEDGTYPAPMVVLSLSFPKPAFSQPPLLKSNEVVALFYKMGSAMHCIFGQTKYQLIRGSRCAYDLSKVPSYLMVYFASDSRVLQKFAKHHQTQEVISNDLIEKLSKYKKKFSAYNTQRMVFNAAFDQACHSGLIPYFSSSEIFQQVWNQHFGSSGMLARGEIDKYYHFIHKRKAHDYSHLMSFAIAYMIWRKYFKEDPLSQLAGQKYRKEFLAQSGLKPARVLVENYLQMNLTPECLSNALFNKF